MKNKIIFIIVFLYSFLFSLSVVQQWNFENSSKDLLSSGDHIKEWSETKDGLYVKLYKKISKENGEVVYKKYLTVYYNGNFVYDNEVKFDNIQNYFHFENDNIVCPKGKYHPHYFYDNTYSTLNLDTFHENGDWELKCISHEQGYFLVFYLMNGSTHFFYKKSGSNTWGNQVLHQEIYDVKLNSILTNYEYPLAYLVKSEDGVKLKGAKYTIKADGIYTEMIAVEMLILWMQIITQEDVLKKIMTIFIF